MSRAGRPGFGPNDTAVGGFLARVMRLSNEELIALATYRDDEADAAGAIDRARSAIETAAAQAGFSESLHAARRELEHWAIRITDSGAGVFAMSAGLDRLDLRMAALPVLLDAIDGLAARGIAPDAAVETLLAPWRLLVEPLDQR